MFLLSCYTGLSYIEVCRLGTKEINIDIQGDQWIEMTRQKTLNTTELKFSVLLLPQAIEILECYRALAGSKEAERIFPCPTNQHTNRCLKQIAKYACITKHLTFHVARYTFATTVTLENGVSIESVAHMLGPSSTRTTQIYSKVKKKRSQMK